MSKPFSFSLINWAGQQQGTSGTSDISNSAARGDRNATKRAMNAAKGGSAMPQPLMGHTASSPSFETVNTFLAAALDGDQQAMTALAVFGNSSVSRAVGTGQIAARGRRR